MINNLSMNKKMEKKNDNIFPCGKIGIDCEWCENKVKCLNKQFYSEKLYEAQGHKFTLEPYIEEIVKLFSVACPPFNVAEKLHPVPSVIVFDSF